MDISDTLAPKSDQLDAVDLWDGSRTFTITRVSRNNGEQPVNVHLAEFPRVWRPGKSMRRVLAYCWGTDANEWANRLVRLYCDESVRFGSEAVGGTRISHLSHIDGAKKVPLIVAKGRSATFHVLPLTPDLLRADWKAASPDARKVIEAQVAALTNTELPAASVPTDPAPQDDNDETEV